MSSGESTIGHKGQDLLGCSQACVPLALSSLQTPAAVKTIGGVPPRAGDKAGPLEVSLRGYYGRGKYLCCEDGTLHLANGSHLCRLIAPCPPVRGAAAANSWHPRRKPPFCGDQDGDIVFTYLSGGEGDQEGRPGCKFPLKQKQTAPALLQDASNKLWPDSGMGQSPRGTGCPRVPPLWIWEQL